MQITDILQQVGGLQSVARELGISESQATSGADALLPAILGGFKKQAQSAPGGLGGIGGLGGLLEQLGGGGLLDQVLSPQPTNVSAGNEVLGQIFGSPEVSRSVASSASAQSGLDPSILKKMLPMLAMLVAGYMARQSGGGPAPQAAPDGGLGGLGGLLGGLLGGSGGTAGGVSTGGMPGLGAMLDMNGDGNPLDDILRLAGSTMGSRGTGA